MPSPTQPANYKPALDEAFKYIEKAIQQCRQLFNKIVAHVQDYWWSYGPVVQWWIKSSLVELSKALQKILRIAQVAVRHHWPVRSLIDRSFAWVDIKKSISDVSSPTVTFASDQLYHWRGGSFVAYFHKTLRQRDAVDDCVSKAEFVSDWLLKIAKTNVEYAVELNEILTGLVGKLSKALVEVSTIFDTPWAVSTIAGIVGDLVEQGLNMLLSIGQRFVDALGNVRDLGSQVGDHSKLPGGHWPHAVRG